MSKTLPIDDNIKVEVYQTLPTATKTVFERAIPLSGGATSEKVSKLVLYAPNLNLIGCLDNSKTKAKTVFSKAITTGFSFTEGMTFGVGMEATVGVEFFKATVKTSFEMSFTSSWNYSETQTITFEAPAGERIFMYQGSLNYRIIEYIPAELTFQYADQLNVVDLNIVQTSEIPLVGAVTDVTNL